jgi:hypothetical protein
MELLERDELMDALDKGLKKSVAQNVNVNQFRKLYAIAKSSEKAIEAIKNSTVNSQIDEMDSLFENLGKLVDLVNSNLGREYLPLTLLGDSLKRGSGASLADAGTGILAALEKFKRDSEGHSLMGVQKQKIDALTNQLNRLGRSLVSGRNSKGEILKPASWSRIFTNLFSLGVSEGLAFTVQKHANTAVQDTILNSIQMMGNSTHKPIYKPAKGPHQIGSKAITGKTDIQKKHLNFSIKQNGMAGVQSNFEIDVGLSVKFLTSYSFKPLKGKMGKMDISSGSGGSFYNAINEIYGMSARNKYYAYNVAVHSNELKEASKNLNSALLQREVVRLFASTGSSTDFSQYIFANGEIISIWELVKYVTSVDKNFLGKSLSQDTGQVINISLQGRDAAVSANKGSYSGSVLIQAFKRSRAVNQALNRVKIKAVLHADRLVKAVGKKP